MRINFHGRLVEEPRVRAGFIGCGSHSFRNIYPTFQFAPVDLAATCDLDLPRAQAFAAQFGADNAYADYRRMLNAESLDAVFVVTGYGEDGRPQFPDIACDCLAAGCHVWIEKPPAASCAQIDRMRSAAAEAGKHVMVGFKKMFFPANEKAKSLAADEAFGQPSLVLLQYPQRVPPAEGLAAFRAGDPPSGAVRGFLDHLCHPVSLMVFLLGEPVSLCYHRAASGAGAATFAFDSGALACLALTCGASANGGMERTTIIGDAGRHIVIDNNVRVRYHRSPPREPGTGYGSAPTYFTGTATDATAVWEPEFSLGQLYNKGLFLLGYYNEVNEFARSILDGRPPAKATLDEAWTITRIFEAFADGPDKMIALP